MPCDCAVVMAPCHYCENSYECDSCGGIKYIDGDGLNKTNTELLCDVCVNKECSHDWRLYEGFTSWYNYCTKCDKKD